MSPAPEAMPAAPGPSGHAPGTSRLRRALAALDAWYRPVGVPERLAALRLLIGGFAAIYVTARLPNLLGLSELGGFRGVGVTSVLSAALPAWAVTAQALLAAVLGVAFFLGYKFRFTGPAFALALLWVMTYRNSFGMVFHTENLLVTHVLVLGCSRAADVWSLDARRRPPPAPARSYGWPVQLLALLTVAGYLLAGIAKLRLSGLSWASSDLLRNYIAYDNLRKLMLADTYSPIGAWLVGYPALFPPLAFASLAMELLAPLALLGRRAAAVWSLAAWSFHLGVLAIMAIFFPYPLFGLAFAPFFAVERLFLFRKLRARWAASG